VHIDEESNKVNRKKTVGAKEWFAWVWIGAFLLLAISTNGIFQGLSLHSSVATLNYERPILYCLLICILCIVWISINIFHKSFELERRMFYAFASIALCLVYIISSANSQSVFLATYGIWTSLMITLFFIAGTLLIQYDRWVLWFPKVYLIFGYIIVFYGFLNLLGNTFLLDSLAFYEGIRITSIFQYANAYAILLLTLWIVAIIEIDRTKKKWVRLCHSFMMVPVCVSFLLTLSRGAIVILPIIAIVVLMMFKLKQQLMAIIYSVIAFTLSLLLYSPLEQAGTKVYENIQQAITSQTLVEIHSIFSSPSVGSWGLLFAVSMAMAVCSYFVMRYLEPTLKTWTETIKTVWADMFVPLFILLLFLAGGVIVSNQSLIQLLPNVIANRLSNISLETHSVFERLTMYKDAISIFKNRPLIGNGGGAWEAFYEQHQSYSYLSSQTHGYLTQLLIDVGILGTLVFMGLIIVVIFNFVKDYKRLNEEARGRYIFYLVVPITILLHSLIDFGMSYLFYSLIVFLCLGVLAGTQRKKTKWELKTKARKRVQWSVTVVTSVLVLCILIQSSRQISAINKFKEAQNDIVNNVIFERIDSKLDQSLSLSSRHPVILLQSGIINFQVFKQTQEKKYLDKAIKYIERLNKYEPRYREAAEWIHAIALAQGDPERAVSIALNAVQQYPFDSSLYDLAATDLVNRWDSIEKSDTVSRERVRNQIEDLYETMKQHQEMNDALPDTINLMRTFAVSEIVKAAKQKTQ